MALLEPHQAERQAGGGRHDLISKRRWKTIASGVASSVFRLYLGYAGWEASQLEWEMGQEAWEILSREMQRSCSILIRRVY
jgi:putative AlgH/UPF0301 family transcriptional regulator